MTCPNIHICSKLESFEPDMCQLCISAKLNPEPSKYHLHLNENGFAIKCYHTSKAVLMNWQFWAGLTLGFPIEHFIWEKMWPFYLITNFLGLK